MNLDYSKNNTVAGIKVDSTPYEHNRGRDTPQPDGPVYLGSNVEAGGIDLADGLALHSNAVSQIEQMADRIDHLEFMVDAQHKMITGINKYLKAYVATRVAISWNSELQDLNESWPK